MDTMNGLKTIRRQCNFSLTELAEQLGVTRQAMSAWENGKKQIPQSRKTQIAEFFGLEEFYLDEITEEQRQELIRKPMYRLVSGWKDKYRYKPMNNKGGEAVYVTERQMSVDRELEEAQRKFKSLENRLKKLKLDRCGLSEEVWILYIHGNFEVLSILTDIIENLDCSDEKSLKEGYEQIRSTLSELKRKIKRGLKNE